MDRTPPSEGGDAGSIPAESTRREKRTASLFDVLVLAGAILLPAGKMARQGRAAKVATATLERLTTNKRAQNKIPREGYVVLVFLLTP